MSVSDFATIDPDTVSGANPCQLYNLVNGEWMLPRASTDIVDPLNGEAFIKMPNTQVDELAPFVASLKSCPKSGLHNPFKNPERYTMYGSISARMAEMLRKPEVEYFFARCIQRVCPKTLAQAKGEVTISRIFLENFSGDQVRFLARGFCVSGDYMGQRSNGLRWPFGPVCLISPFNFPLEIPILQLMGALYMGNKVTLKCASTTSMIMEQLVRMMHFCGVPKTDVDLIHCGGRVMSELIRLAEPRNTQFTGGQEVAEQLAALTHGKVRLEDAGFDWKVLGPDATLEMLEYVAWQCDQDAYAHSGQKCSAQSILFAHQNWVDLGLLRKTEELAARRNLEELSIAPILSHTTEEMIGHKDALCRIPGARLLWGGEELPSHTIPKKYGAIKPTAVFVPLHEILKPEHFGLVTTEIFGPFQVVTEYRDEDLPLVLECLERMSHHLTAAIVSNDIQFCQKVYGSTVNGTTYVGIRARTTGAPQNHWFGPAGDPRGAGIGTVEAIRLVWSCHREMIEDFGPVPDGWVLPKPT
eukprot:gnl/Trimastix_PCT/72.p2 GENE.gnl/Trimastix_PCT/72~~gnl/Trimastix_PCT/72.p2  ORF type:complete len:527 (+),score=163.84 gnl/Trimastix_PCT/72:2419-3999(+)